ncbi:MAG: adenylyl-sulfate kinase [Actinomycetales bacterium]
MTVTTTHVSGATVWLTGLSGAGKTTIATALAERLRAEGRPVQLLDGDDLRAALSPDLGFDRVDRDQHVRRVGWVAATLARHGVLALVPVIAPYAAGRLQVARVHAAAALPYLEVHVATPVEVCELRDVKGLYAKARAGELRGLTGLDDPYEPPTAPDLRLDTADRSVQACAAALHALLVARGLA